MWHLLIGALSSIYIVWQLFGPLGGFNQDKAIGCALVLCTLFGGWWYRQYRKRRAQQSPPRPFAHRPLHVGATPSAEILPEPDADTAQAAAPLVTRRKRRPIDVDRKLIRGTLGDVNLILPLIGFPAAVGVFYVLAWANLGYYISVFFAFLFVWLTLDVVIFHLRHIYYLGAIYELEGPITLLGVGEEEGAQYCSIDGHRVWDDKRQYRQYNPFMRYHVAYWKTGLNNNLLRIVPLDYVTFRPIL